MAQLAQGAGQAAADLPQTLGLGELTKQHSHKMIPRRIPLGVTLRSMTVDEFMKPLTIDHCDQLTEQVRIPYHGPSSFAGFGLLVWRSQPYPNKEDFF